MLAPDSAAEGRFIGKYAVEHLNARTAIIYFHADEYGVGLRDAVVDDLNKRGVRVIDQVSVNQFDVHIPPGDAYTSLVTASLKRGMPDVVVIAARTREAGQVARLIHERAPGVRFIGGDGVEFRDDFLALAGKSIDSFYMVAFWHSEIDDEQSRDFAERYRKLAGREPLSGDAMRYDAAMVLAHAMRAVGADCNAIRRFINELGTSRPPYQGVTGPISFAKDRPARLIMTSIRNGKLIPLSSS